MKKAFFFTGILGVMALTSCVSLSEHENLQAKYDQTAKQYRLTLQERDELRENNANLTKTNNALTSDYNELSAAKQRCDGMVDSLVYKKKDAKVKTLKDFPYGTVYGKLLKAPQDYNDVKTLVVADYQDQLEREWVADLRRRYPFTVNFDVVKTVNNH